MTSRAVRLIGRFFFLYAFGIVAVLATMPAHVARADNRAPLNGAEIDAKSLCGNDRRGAIWFTNSSNYYSNSVTVSSDQTSVEVYIRGSVYSCAQTPVAHTGATDIVPQGANAWRLTDLQSTELDRGTVSGDYNWSSQGGQVVATLNVQGLATNNIGRSDSQTITIDLYRCFYNYTNSKQGSCYAQTISITVNRAMHTPLYTFDDATCSTTWGWIVDTAQPGYSLAAHVQVDGVTRVWGTANTYRPDVNTSFKGAVGDNHGFSIDISPWVQDAGSHTVEVFTYAIDSSGKTVGGPISIGKKQIQNCYNYDIYPRTKTSSSVITYGQTATIDADLFNNGTTATQYDVPRTVYEFVLPSGTSIDNYISSSSYASKTLKNSDTIQYLEPSLADYGSPGTAGCSQWATHLGIANCTMPGVDGVTNGILSVVAEGGGNWQASGIKDAATTITADDYQVGQTVCRFMAIRTFDANHDQNDMRRRVSKPACVQIGKKPKVQVQGGDLASGGLVQTSVTSTISNGTYGSWGEYLVTALGSVNGTASARGYAGGTASTRMCSVSYLTLVNAPGGSCSESSNTKGMYSAVSNVASRAASLASLFSQTTPLGGQSIDVASHPNGVFSGSGTITVKASAGVGGTIIINAPDADVVVADSIRYTNSTIAKSADIPQVVIIANTITIQSTVSQVDAWLVASGANGTIKTCTDVSDASNLRTTNCTTPLLVDGPVMAKRLLLYRTSGSDKTTLGDPAEVFNLRPDAYLWLQNYLAATPKARTVITKELPPRY